MDRATRPTQRPAAGVHGRLQHEGGNALPSATASRVDEEDEWPDTQPFERDAEEPGGFSTDEARDDRR